MFAINRVLSHEPQSVTFTVQNITGHPQGFTIQGKTAEGTTVQWLLKNKPYLYMLPKINDTVTLYHIPLLHHNHQIVDELRLNETKQNGWVVGVDINDMPYVRLTTGELLHSKKI